MKMQPMTFAEMLAADDFAPDTDHPLWKSFEELGRNITAKIKKRLNTEFPEEANRFSKKTLIGAGLVIAQMEYHRYCFGLNHNVPVHPEMFIAMTAKAPQMKGFNPARFAKDFDDLMVLLGYTHGQAYKC